MMFRIFYGRTKLKSSRDLALLVLKTYYYHCQLRKVPTKAAFFSGKYYDFGGSGKNELVRAIYLAYPGLFFFKDFSNKLTPDTFIRNMVIVKGLSAVQKP